PRRRWPDHPGSWPVWQHCHGAARAPSPLSRQNAAQTFCQGGIYHRFAACQGGIYHRFAACQGGIYHRFAAPELRIRAYADRTRTQSRESPIVPRSHKPITRLLLVALTAAGTPVTTMAMPLATEKG